MQCRPSQKEATTILDLSKLTLDSNITEATPNSPEQFGIWEVDEIGFVLYYKGVSNSDDTIIDTSTLPIPTKDCHSTLFESRAEQIDPGKLLAIQRSWKIHSSQQHIQIIVSRIYSVLLIWPLYQCSSILLTAHLVWRSPCRPHAFHTVTCSRSWRNASMDNKITYLDRLL